MNKINVENCKTLLIGRRGENEVTTVAFDFTEWASEFGSGVVDLYVKRFGDNSAYPVVLTIDGTVASWLVTETDTNVAGYGKAEYVYRVDGKIAKSAVFPFFVAEDIGQPASEPPDPYESWLEQLTALGAETEAHAQAAEQSAENAAQSAEDAAQSAASVEGAVEQAEAARDAAQTAQASAEASATAASGSATSAAGSATSAAGSASDASESASAASDSATAAGDAETQAEAAKTAAQAAQSAAEDAAEDAQQAAQQAHVEYEQLSGEVDDLSDEVTQQKSAIEDLQALTNRKAGMLVDTASGAIASFVPDSTIDNLLGVAVAIEPVQAGSGDPSPDNVRPISGWNSVGIDSTGVNLFDKANVSSVHAYFANGNSSLMSGSQFETVCLPCKPNTTYSIKNTANNRANLAYTKEIPAVGVSTFGGTQNSITTGADAKYLVAYVYNSAVDAVTFDDVKNALQIAVGSAVPTAYHPFAGNRYTIQLGQTVYGGTLDVTNGTLTVDRAMVDLGTLNWGYSSADVRFYNNSVAYKRPASATEVANAICSQYAITKLGTLNNGTMCLYMNGYIYVKDSRYTDAAAFKTAMSGVQLVYELATPITIQLDPVTISTISGQTNNVWSDAGDVSVEFAADLKNYIDSKIAAAVAAMS